MKLVSKRDDIVDNVKTLEGYLVSKKAGEKEFAVDIIAHSTEYVVYKVNGENHFAPTSFVAYKNNDMKSYLSQNKEEEAREVHTVMNKVVGLPFSNATTEEKFHDYVSALVKKVPDKERQYFRIKDERRKNLDIRL